MKESKVMEVTAKARPEKFNMSDAQKIPVTCATCRWWLRGRTLSNQQPLPGQCRRNPPVPVAGGNRWPATDGHEWCGEHHKLHEEFRAVGEDALSRLDKHLTDTAGAAPAGQPAEEAGAAVLKTGGAETDMAREHMVHQALATAEAALPRIVKPAAFERPARRR